MYPPESRELADRISGAGTAESPEARLSQFPMGAAPLPQHFPLRNWLIAALTVGTVVVAPGERSGALIA